MAKLKLKADPTFKATVSIPVAGGADVPVEFTFKHRTRAEVEAFLPSIPGRAHGDVILEIAVAWELSDAFTRESIQEMVENYIGSGDRILDRYLEELTAARRKN